ncbi:MAG TPA: DUF4836 family protein, partial [Bacteroidales bacterium]|nr:DUF4836 family protein [Bacteroidales bacterium]
QVIFLISPDMSHTEEEWQNELVSLYELEKENAVTSIVDFVDFSGKMQDMNLWFTGDQLKKILDNSDLADNMDVQLPVELYNNYGQLFVEFADGAMYVSSETHFSDDVVKAASSMMVAKEKMNDELLKLAPGNDLLMGMAFSLEIDNLVKMVQGVSPPEMDSLSPQIEKITGIKGDEILEALSGDFVIAVNGAEEGASIPVEILIGIGLDDKTLQEKIMGTVGNMADVQEEGDFFMINANGMELYSGIVEGIWVITNTPGYKDAVTGDGLNKTLLDSKFSEYTDGAMGMYMNLDISTYPAPIQGMLAQAGAPQMLDMVTTSFVSLGIEASNKENLMTLKSSNNNENSLYTLLQILETAAAQN